MPYTTPIAPENRRDAIHPNHPIETKAMSNQKDFPLLHLAMKRINAAKPGTLSFYLSPEEIIQAIVTDGTPLEQFCLRLCKNLELDPLSIINHVVDEILYKIEVEKITSLDTGDGKTLVALAEPTLTKIPLKDLDQDALETELRAQMAEVDCDCPACTLNRELEANFGPDSTNPTIH